MDILLHLLAAALYGALGAYFWRALKGKSPMAAPRGLSRIEQLLCLAPISLHGWLLSQQLFPAGTLSFGVGIAISLIVWLAIVVYWLEGFSARLQSLQTLALPVAALGVAAPLVLPGVHAIHSHSQLFVLHFLVAMLAYALATLAAIHAVFMAFVERRLHSGRLSRVLAGAPPVLTMETLLFRMIGVAFALLTLTLVSGVLFSEALFGRALILDHKTLFAVVSWAIFGTLLFGRLRWGWRGRTALHWTLAGFITLMLAYVGTRFVLEVILGRGAPLA